MLIKYHENPDVFIAVYYLFLCLLNIPKVNYKVSTSKRLKQNIHSTYKQKQEPGLLSRDYDGLRAGWPGFDSRQRPEIFLYFTETRLALGPIQPPIHWVLGRFSWT
jgi:hypothetical protein